MNHATPDFNILVERLSRLERQNRLFKGIGCALALMLLVGLVAAAQERGQARTVEAERFLLKDGRGKVRAELGMDKNGVHLLLHDENEKVRLDAAVFQAGPGMALLDEAGAVRYSVSINNKGPVLSLADENQKPRAVLRVFKEGPGLAFLDEKDADRTVLSYTTKNGASLDMFDADKQQVMALRAKSGLNGLALFDESGRPRAALIDGKSGPKIELLDENEQPLFRKP